MTLVDMLRRIIESEVNVKTEPDGTAYCAFCMREEGHYEDCVWGQAEEWLEKFDRGEVV